MEDLISKKRFWRNTAFLTVRCTGGKRMGLIPEAWFIRKSTATGQETFFRRDQVCPRVELILSRRDGTSLEQLAGELEGERAAPLSQAPHCGRPVWTARVHRRRNPEAPVSATGSGKAVF